jgi:hypothetical protein
MEEKVCTTCNLPKALDDFHRNCQRADGHLSRCKSCVKEYRNLHPLDNTKVYKSMVVKDPQYNRKRNLKKLYNITLEEFDEMLKSQDGVCKVCKRPQLGKGDFHVDHDHETGKIRGLLCHKCNVALGMVQDDIQILKKLINYLESNKLHNLVS